MNLPPSIRFRGRPFTVESLRDKLCSRLVPLIWQAGPLDFRRDGHRRRLRLGLDYLLPYRQRTAPRHDLNRTYCIGLIPGSQLGMRRGLQLIMVSRQF